MIKTFYDNLRYLEYFSAMSLISVAIVLVIINL